MRKVFLEVTVTLSLVMEVEEGIDVDEAISDTLIETPVCLMDGADITDLQNTHFDNVLVTDSK